MSIWDEMRYGPLGAAVEAAMPQSEADPIGVYAASLAMFSASISRGVRLENGRPVVVWTVLAGRSAIGRKGYALGTAKALIGSGVQGFLNARTRNGVGSGPALVDLLYKTELTSLATSEDGLDGRVMIEEEEWAGILKVQKKCAKFSTLFRTAWDGKEIANETKKDGRQRVERPLLGFHAHITPGEWGKYVSSSDALGGSYNRLLPVMVERSKMLPYDHRPNIQPSRALTKAYRWAIEEQRIMRFSRGAGDRYDELRLEIETRMEDMTELMASYLERSAEQVQRVAAVLTAAEMQTEISRAAVEAAWAFVSYSMTSVERLVKEAEAAGGGAGNSKSVEDKIRDAIKRYGGELTHTILLRSLGSRVNTKSLKKVIESMPDIKVTEVKTPGRGANPTHYSLLEGEELAAAERQADEAEEAVTAPILSIVPPSGKPKRRVAPKVAARREVPRVPAAPAQPTNPFAALL